VVWAVVLIAACAGLPPEKPITDRTSVIGTWKGTAYVGGVTYPTTLTMKSDGTWQSTSTLPPGTFNGTWQLAAGRVTWRSNVSRRMGMLTLHDVEGTRTMRWWSEDGAIDFTLTSAPSLGR
jgi:hypothetical protein